MFKLKYIKWLLFAALVVFRVLISAYTKFHGKSQYDSDPFVSSTLDFGEENITPTSINSSVLVVEQRISNISFSPPPISKLPDKPSGPKIWSIDEAILAVQNAQQNANPSSKSGKMTNKKGLSQKGDKLSGKSLEKEWDLPEVKLLAERKERKSAEVEDEDPKSKEEKEENLVILERLMKGGIRSVKEKKMDKGKVAALLDRCRPQDEPRSKWSQHIQPVTEWDLPSPEVTHTNGFVGFLHKILVRPRGDLEPAPMGKSQLGERVFRKCSVVGPSSTLHRQGYPNDIDRADIVVRLNTNPTSHGKYQQLVGSRATFRFLNEFWVLQYADPRRLKFLELEPNVTLVLTQRHEEVNNIRRALTHMRREDVQVVGLNEGWYWGAHQLLLAYKICLKNSGRVTEGGDMPTAGFLAVYSLMHVCHTVHVYGFSSEKTKAGVRATYFKDDLPKVTTMTSAANRGGKHSYDAEYALMKALSGIGRFTLCGTKGCRTGSEIYTDNPMSEN